MTNENESMNNKQKWQKLNNLATINEMIFRSEMWLNRTESESSQSKTSHEPTWILLSTI